MTEKDILADIGRLSLQREQLQLQREQLQRHDMLIQQRLNDLKVELMKVRKDGNDPNDAEPRDSASGQRDDG